MEHRPPRRRGRGLDTRGVDRSELRLRLLETWTQALIDGHFATGVPLSREDRQASVDQLSLLACIGLPGHWLQVRFDDFERLRRLRPPPSIIPEVERRLKELSRGFDIRLAATWGMRLGLVEARGNGVRFPHSIIQAYLGSRLIDLAMEDPQYSEEALADPGRELLIALVMNSRTKVQPGRPGPAAPAVPGTQVPDPTAGEGPDGRLQSLLRTKARQNDHVKALYLFAASLQVDSVDENSAHGDIAADIAETWPDMYAQDKRSLEEAKLNLVRRFGEAVRMIASQRPSDPAHTYCQLYNITIDEPSSSIRVEGAQEIGAGGDQAFSALKGHLGPLDPSYFPNAQAAAPPGQAAAPPGQAAAPPGQAGQAGDTAPGPESPAGRHPPARHQDEPEGRGMVSPARPAPPLG